VAIPHCLFCLCYEEQIVAIPHCLFCLCYEEQIVAIPHFRWLVGLSALRVRFDVRLVHVGLLVLEFCRNISI